MITYPNHFKVLQLSDTGSAILLQTIKDKITTTETKEEDVKARSTKKKKSPEKKKTEVKEEKKKGD